MWDLVCRDSSVGIATGYGLDGPGIESRWGARFSAPVQTGPGDRPASCTMGTGSFPGVKRGRGVTLTPHPLLVSWTWKGRAITLLTPWAVRPLQGRILPLPFFIKFPQYIATISLHNNNRSGLTTDSVSDYSGVGNKLLNICYFKFVLKATLCHVSGGLLPHFSEKTRVRFRPSICKIYGEKLAVGQVFLRAIRLPLFGAVALQHHTHLSLSNTFTCRTNWRSLVTFGNRWASHRYLISYSWLKAANSDVLQKASYVLHITCFTGAVCGTHILSVLI